MNLHTRMSCLATMLVVGAFSGPALAQSSATAPAPEAPPLAEAAATMAPPPAPEAPLPVEAAAPMAPPAAPEAPPFAEAAAPMAPPPAPKPTPAPTVLANQPQSPFKIETPNGSSIRLGLLLQPQFQSASSAALDGYSSNLYLRRTRVLLGGTLFGLMDYFVDTDYPNLFLAQNSAPAGMPANFQKNTPGMNVQDAFVTAHPFGDVFKVDAGYMLPPLAHNAVQGATTLYSWDYFGFTFQSGNDFGSTANPIGRDLGVEVRGLVLGGHLEYRGGMFQGLRSQETATDVASNNFFRLDARIQVNLLDPEPGFFYAGTYLGAKRILSLGGSVDFQDSYKYFATDGFVDLPLGGGLLTGQVNLAHWNGGSFIPALVSQTALMGEAGFLFAGIALSPIARAEYLWVSGGANQSRVGGGVAFWPFGHNTNLKAFYTSLKTDGAARSTNQFNVQCQLYFF
jgi:hypothetical protein